MSKEKLKKELHELIDKMEDEEMLSMVKEDIEVYHKTASKFDDLSDLTEEERAELEELANEDPNKDSLTHVEFKNFMQEWRNKLSTKSGS